MSTRQTIESSARQRFVKAMRSLNVWNEHPCEPNVSIGTRLRQVAKAFADVECESPDGMLCGRQNDNHAICRGALLKEIFGD